MAVQFTCSQCRQTLKVDDRFAGAKIRCPKCRAITVAPVAGAAGAAARRPSAPRDAGKAEQSKRALPDTFDEIEPVDFSKREREESEMDMTPMVDVTFLLLIFFMITAAFSLQKSLEIPKPSEDNAVTQATVVDPEEGNIIIRIDRDSTVWINESEAPSEQDLLVKLREAQAGVPGSNSPPINSVLVKADGDAIHKVVVMVLDACNDVNMETIKLATVSEDDF
ncbi:MAG: biopolymer transporter ExbD [Pirellulales bacterium]|nr:biopolymer transporter ExbD [Pirellulales bacterium]